MYGMEWTTSDHQVFVAVYHVDNVNNGNGNSK